MDGLLMGVLTGSTCGFACWEAQEETCRCSCGGRNHGIMRGGILADGKAKPNRQAKIDGVFYTLVEVAEWRSIKTDVSTILNDSGPRKVYMYTVGDASVYSWTDKDEGSPCRVKPISKAQMKWPECADKLNDYFHSLRGVWVRDYGLSPIKGHPEGFNVYRLTGELVCGVYETRNMTLAEVQAAVYAERYFDRSKFEVR
jgi:hypothetical protein